MAAAALDHLGSDFTHNDADPERMAPIFVMSGRADRPDSGPCEKRLRLCFPIAAGEMFEPLAIRTAG
ncbi:MAG: hypothetical protein C3F11_13810 [Methylocystaceae bacterium]|nr:MAG: hypothetical protein C3F11_13810 [Methylocystaceae bacterium]